MSSYYLNYNRMVFARGDQGSNGRRGYGFNAGQQQEQEIATRNVQIHHKRFYLDVKQNARGKFLKIAEVASDGRRNQVFFNLSAAADFRDHLTTFNEYIAQLDPPNPDSIPEDGRLKSEVLTKETRRYYLDLRENQRGRFLRVSQATPRMGQRIQVAIPAEGLAEFRDTLTNLLDEVGTDEYKGELPEGRHMRVDNKSFYFDIGQNNRGVYMRISEVKANFRAAITIPEKSWPQFRDYFADYCEKMKECSQKQNSGLSSGGQESSVQEDSGNNSNN